MDAKQVAAARAEKIKRAYLSVAQTEEGRTIMGDIMHRGKLLRPCTNPEDEGRRRLALEILGIMTQDEEAFLEQLKTELQL